jgi:hypothetical protein
MFYRVAHEAAIILLASLCKMLRQAAKINDKPNFYINSSPGL